MKNEKSCINSKIVIEKAILESGKDFESFKINPNVILFFSGFLLEKLRQKIELREEKWLAPYHPYASSKIFLGKHYNSLITAISPPMGASPMACVVEDLIFCGAKNILLVCGSWGIGKNVKLLDFIIPTHCLGKDGTSIYYKREEKIDMNINDEIVNILFEVSSDLTSNIHKGKNFSIEAFYKIKKNKILKLRKKGIISIENGELNVLNIICKQNKIKFGCIFYNYFNPLEDWKIPWMNSEKYRECVELELDISLETLKRLKI